jgi:L-lactate dehydrogenase complex protein LldG
MSARDNILSRLRAARQPFTEVPPVDERRPMAPMDDASPSALRARFIAEAGKVGAKLHEAADDESAIAAMLALIADDRRITGWSAEQVGVRGLAEALSDAGVAYAEPRDGTVRVGLTGVDAAIAATGSLIVTSGAGRPRSPSLVPHTHIAVVRGGQILANLEAWYGALRAAGLDDFRAHSNTVVITGSSRTADIAQELIMGAHGPVVLHVVLI